MERWKLTPVLALSALLAAAIAPDLFKQASPVDIPEADAAALSGLSARVSELAVFTTDPVSPVSTAPTTPTDELRISASLDQSSLLRGAGEDHFLVVSFQAPETEVEARQPVHMALVVDTSGSMAGAGKIDFARQATQALVSKLGPEDSFSLVTFDDNAQVHIGAQPVTDPDGFYSTIAALAPGGGTNIAPGLALGLQQLNTIERPGVKRAVLVSDGLSTESRDHLAAMSASQLESGTTVSAIGLGADFDDHLLLAMSGAGGGTYSYVDQAEQLSALFDEELKTLGSVSSRGVTLEVSLGAGVEVLDVYGYEQYNGEIVGGGYRAFIGDMYAGEVRKVVARVRVPDGALGVREVADVTVSYSGAEKDSARVSVERAINVTITDDASLASASVDSGVGALAAQAFAGDVSLDGNTWWRTGNREAMRSTFAEGVAALKVLEGRYQLPEVTARREALEVSAAEFESLVVGSQYGKQRMIDSAFHNTNDCY